jgi:hypothetical protein
MVQSLQYASAGQQPLAPAAQHTSMEFGGHAVLNVAATSVAQAVEHVKWCSWRLMYADG